MVYKIEYTMYDGRCFAEYVRTWSGMQKILREVLRHKDDNASVEKVEVYTVERVPILRDEENKKFVLNLAFARE